MADEGKLASLLNGRPVPSSTLPASEVSGSQREEPISSEPPPTASADMIPSGDGDGAPSTSKKETAVPDKPLALRKTPRTAAGSNMYRGKVPRRMSSAKSLDASTAEAGSPGVDVKSQHANSPAEPIPSQVEIGPPAAASGTVTPKTPASGTVTPKTTASGTVTPKTAASATVTPRTPASGTVTSKTAASSKKRKRKSKATPNADPRSAHNESGPGTKRIRKQAAAISKASPSSPLQSPLLPIHPTKPAKDKQNDAGDANAADGDAHDEYCWLCHHLCADGSSPFSCDLCPRSYHAKCFGGQATDDTTGWICPECRAVLRAENTDTLSPAMQILELEQLCSLLKFALARMKVLCPVEFLQPVDLAEFPTYRSHVVHPMDMGQLDTNLQHRMYGSTESFLADAKWLLHNCVVFNGPQHKLSQVAKSLLKVCRQEMAEIEVCPDCYRNAHTKRGNWFVETCNLPHLLVWAKLKGFPFWPGKAMRIVSGSVDVRFFGAHDRAWISLSQCYLLSRTPPTAHKNKKRMFDQSMDELESHVRRLRERFGAFEYAPLRSPLVEKNVVDDVRAMLPQLEDPGRIERFMVGPAKPKCEEGITGDSSNPGEDNASDSASRGSLVQAASRPPEEIDRNLESTIERLFRRRKKAAKKSSSGDDESASVGSNFAPSRSGANSISGESIASKPDMQSTLSNAASESTSCDRAENDGETRAPSASNDGASDNNDDDDNSNKANDESEDYDRNNGDCSRNANGDGSGSENDEEGGLVIDTSTDDDNDDDETEDSKPDAVEERGSPISSQASGREGPGDNDEDEDAEEVDAKEDIAAALPILKRHSRSDGLSNPGDDSLSSGDFAEHSRKGSAGAATIEDTQEDDAAGNEALVRRLHKELDRIKWQYRQEMAEARHNADLVLLEMRRSLEAEREREVAAIRRRAEAEKARAVRDTKRRQWCVVCLEEASLMCCWNTHYCDYPCQRKHWPLHVGSCPRGKSSNLEADEHLGISDADRVFH